MNAFAIERVLWEITDSLQNITQFIQAPDELLERYSLSEEEYNTIKQKDVRRMSDSGVSAMLLMLFWMATSGGNASMPEYMQRMNTPAN